MSKFKYLLFFLISFSFLVTSCTKENIDETETIEEEVDPTTTTKSNGILNRSNNDESTVGLDFACVEVNFPFELVDADGNKINIENDEAFLEVFYDSVTYDNIVDFVYPLSVTLDDGTEVEVENGEQLAEYFAECLPSGGWTDNYFPAYVISEENSCFTLSYPVTIIDELSNSEVIDNEADLTAKLAEKEYSFGFPLTLLDEDGAEVQVNNVEELINALISCNGFNPGDTTIVDWNSGFEYIGCYEIVFPFSVVTTEGETVEVNNHEELCDIMLQGNMEGYAFPLTLLHPDGEEVVANSEEELADLMIECAGIGVLEDYLLLLSGAVPRDTLGSEAVCYNINFPLSTNVITPSGEEEVHEFNSLEEMIVNELPVVSLNYPITVTMVSDGTEVIFNSSTDIFNTLVTCF